MDKELGFEVAKDSMGLLTVSTDPIKSALTIRYATFAWGVLAAGALKYTATRVVVVVQRTY
jgi:hypothetical protein